MFKLALNAGHGLYTAGKRCKKSLDPKQTREWWLNDRICDKIEDILSDYDGIKVLRIDDTKGQTDVPLADRVKKANDFDADFYLSIHHNAGINGGKGGGLMAYVYKKASQTSLEWQNVLYNAAITATGLKGNRSQPKAKANFYENRMTAMPSVLMECGFMDSKTDVPIILSDDFADKLARAICDVIVDRAGATRKKDSRWYRVQVGAYNDKANAETMLKKLKEAGFAGYITLS
jgi:N-acetylmuramoyl-L-alanine amidase